MEPLATRAETALATTQDTIYGGRLTLIQPEKGYRFGMDAMILAASVAAKPAQHVLELGCGVGAAMLGAAFRVPETLFTGIERETDYALCAQENIARNAMKRRVNVQIGDVTDKALFKQLGTFDHVIMNPPYFDGRHSGGKSGSTVMDALRRVARHEDEAGLAEWMMAANRFVKPKGSVTIIHSADRTHDIVSHLQKFCGAIRIFPLWPFFGQDAKRIVVQGVKGSRAPLHIMAGLVLHDQSHNYYTQQADAIINRGAGLWDMPSE